MSPPDIYSCYHNFLETVAKWISDRANSSSTKKDSSACQAMRNANKVWGGVGVYTVSEIFFDAGELSILISPYYNINSTFLFRSLAISPRKRGI